MWSLFFERVTPAHDRPCMIWQGMPTEPVLRLKAAGAHRHFEDIVSRRVAPHLRAGAATCSWTSWLRGADDALKLKGHGHAYYLRAGIFAHSDFVSKTLQTV